MVPEVQQVHKGVVVEREGFQDLVPQRLQARQGLGVDVGESGQAKKSIFKARSV